MDGDDSAFCPGDHRAVELVGRRWTGAILRSLRAGAQGRGLGAGES